MEPPKVINKSYKKIVPLRGNLAQKLKNELMKMTQNDSKTPENGVSDTINNNIDTPTLPVIPEPNISPEKRIIIQKIEVVKLEKIPTDQTGKLRRISSLFEENQRPTWTGSSQVEENENPIHPDAIDKIPDAIGTNAMKDHSENGAQAAPVITLLSAKIPENQFNVKVPLKVVRTIKPPKPKPTLSKVRNRFHRVETLVPPVAHRIDPIDYTGDVEMSALIPDVEMKEEHKPSISIKSLSPKKIENTKKLQRRESDSEPEGMFIGFNSKIIPAIHADIKKWHEALTSDARIQQEEKFISAQPTKQKMQQVSQNDKIASPQKSKPSDEAFMEPVKKIVQLLIKPISENAASNVIPKVKSEKAITEKPDVFQVDINQVSSKPCSSKDIKPVILKTAIPSTSKEVPKDVVTKAFLRGPEPEWQNDLLVVIGGSRLLEIDKSLRAIPNIVTGNAIETENVELRLIIKHLLKKFKLKSIMETIEGGQTADYPNDSNDSSDDDDFPDSFDDDSNDGMNDFGGPSSDCNDESQASGFQEDTCRDVSTCLPETSHYLTMPAEKPQFESTHIAENNSTLIVPDFMTDVNQSEMSINPCDIEEVSVELTSKNPPQITIEEQPEPEISNECIDEEICSVVSDVKESEFKPSQSIIMSPAPETHEIQSEIIGEVPTKRISRKRKKSPSPPITTSTIKKSKSVPNKVIRNVIAADDVKTVPLKSSSRDSSSEASKKLATSASENGGQQTREITKDLAPSENSFSSRHSSTSKATSENELTPIKLKSASIDSDSSIENTQRHPLRLLSNGNGRRTSIRSSSRESSVEPPHALKNTKNSRLIPKQIQKLIDSESDSGLRRRTKRDSGSDSGPQRRSTRRSTRRIESSTDDSDDNRSKLNLHDSSEDEKPLAKMQGPIRKTTKCKIESDSDSNNDSDYKSKTPPCNLQTPRNDELKSRLGPHDFNSTPNSTNPKRNKCLPSSDKIKREEPAVVGNLLRSLGATIGTKRQKDSTYTEMPGIPKRERLRTSAFKRNDNECTNDEDIQDHSDTDTRQPSVSRGSSDDESPEPKPRPNRRKAVVVSDGEKKVFKQEPVENPIEKLVPYYEILEGIKSCVTIKGRHTKVVTDKQIAKKREDLKALKSLKHFICGACNFQISKHLWKQHFIDHGGMAWVEGFEDPVTFEDWNEAVRRTLRSQKSFNITTWKCPHCQQERKSALGHLSHLLVCCESEVAIEEKKITCEVCNDKFLPFNATVHKNKCVKQQTREANDGDDERDANKTSDEENDPTDDNFNSSGRRKRKAVKKAEKMFKEIINSSEKPSDYVKTINGQLKCHVCGETGFKTEEEATEHVAEEHDITTNCGDFGSDSDDAIVENSTSEETEGSSGVESSDPESDEFDDPSDDNDESCVSSKKAKPSAAEPQEVKNGRRITSEYVETLKPNLTSKTIQWTQQFFNKNWKEHVLDLFLPVHKMNFSKEAATVLPMAGFKLNSMKFGFSYIDRYRTIYENPVESDWKQLEIGKDFSDKLSTTIYCGGTVSSVDWAPSTGDSDFIAVACNSDTKEGQMNIKETTKSCIQVYEIKNLTNKDFKGFEGNIKFCYAFIINEGPIWSIKFHPSESSDKRVGLLAVTTANQSTLIYSLPYLNNHKSIVLPLEPNLICKLDGDDILFNDEHLLQVSKVNWFHTKASGSILVAGFINGYVAIWNISNDDHAAKDKTIFPTFAMQPHLERVTALDFKATANEVLLLTCSIDRKLKVFSYDGLRWLEIANHYSVSRVLCAEWWMHWPGYVIGFDDCFTQTSLVHRQPLEFALRNANLLGIDSSIVHMSINHWLNFVMVVTESGDVIGCRPEQMILFYAKSKWTFFNFNIYASTDYNTIKEEGTEEIGIIFTDFKNKTPQPKKFRLPPTDRINELQINQVCFNRSEKSYRFYAMGYETGFVRIRYLKNSK